MNSINLIKKAKSETGFINKIDKKLSMTILYDLANRLEVSSDNLIAANELDFEKFPANDYYLERLLLTKERISGIAKNLRTIANIDSPVNEVIEEKKLENGLNIKKICIPFGVIGIIFEANPEVIFEAFALCLKSGNTVIFKGDDKAEFTDQVVISLIKKSLIVNGISPDILQFLPPEKDALDDLIGASEFINMIISRGSKEQMEYVRKNSKIPVIEYETGIVHVYFDKYGDLKIGKKALLNSKTRRVSLPYSADCLIIHHDRLKDLPDLVMPLSDRAVELEADDDSYSVLKDKYPKELISNVKKNTFDIEYLDYKLAVKTVKTINEAINHIATFGSNICESIISLNEQSIQDFFNKVDAAVIYINTSTAFTNGSELDMGADAGINTKKCHARGPISINELCTNKWYIRSEGAIRQ